LSFLLGNCLTIKANDCESVAFVLVYSLLFSIVALSCIIYVSRFRGWDITISLCKIGKDEIIVFQKLTTLVVLKIQNA